MATQLGRSGHIEVAIFSRILVFVNSTDLKARATVRGSRFRDWIPRTTKREGLSSHEDEVYIYGTDFLASVSFPLCHSRRCVGTNE